MSNLQQMIPLSKGPKGGYFKLQLVSLREESPKVSRGNPGFTVKMACKFGRQKMLANSGFVLFLKRQNSAYFQRWKFLQIVDVSCSGTIFLRRGRGWTQLKALRFHFKSCICIASPAQWAFWSVPSSRRTPMCLGNYSIRKISNCSSLCWRVARQRSSVLMEGENLTV